MLGVIAMAHAIMPLRSGLPLTIVASTVGPLLPASHQRVTLEVSPKGQEIRLPRQPQKAHLGQ